MEVFCYLSCFRISLTFFMSKMTFSCFRGIFSFVVFYMLPIYLICLVGISLIFKITIICVSLGKICSSFYCFPTTTSGYFDRIKYPSSKLILPCLSWSKSLLTWSIRSFYLSRETKRKHVKNQKKRGFGLITTVIGN